MIEHVDPFIGSSVTDLPVPQGLAETWWWPKPQVGNTHPGATYPFGMVSACAYSGAYPTGYGLYQLSTEGVPSQLYDTQIASGFTHFQQSGTGAIRKYYNYFRVTPMVEPLDNLGNAWELIDERAEPGYYAATLSSGIHCELTVGPKSAVHRYTFPAHKDARLVIDFSMGGLAIPYGATVPLRAHIESLGPGIAQAEIVVEGAPLAVHLECDAGDWRQLLWYDRRLMPGGTRLDFDRIRPTTLRPFGLMWRGPTEPGQVLELRFGFSLRGVEQAKRNLHSDCGSGRAAFDSRRAKTATGVAAAPQQDQDRDTLRQAANDLRDCPLPLADQAVLRTRGEPVLADRRTVRVRHLHDVGHLPHPIAADHRPVPGSCRRAGQRPAVHLRGRGQSSDRLPDGQGRGQVLPAGQRAGSHVPGRSLSARYARHRLGLGAVPHGHRPAAQLRRGLSCCAGLPSPSPTRSTWRSATTARRRWPVPR